MKIILCVDEKLGYSFNNRRQSRDKKMREHMLGFLREEGAGLFMNSYSESSLIKDGLFTEEELRQRTEHPAQQGDAFLADAEREGGWAFVENVDISGYLERTDEILLYEWNRLYLSDLRLPDGYLSQFSRLSEEKFKGSSHDSIFCSRLVRKEKKGKDK